jgi:hypothetical protein
VQFATSSDVMPPLLFDLDADPEQVVNLCADGRAARELAWEGAQELLRWHMQTAERTLSGSFLHAARGLVTARDEWR